MICARVMTAACCCGDDAVTVAVTAVDAVTVNPDGTTAVDDVVVAATTGAGIGGGYGPKLEGGGGTGLEDAEEDN